MTVILVISMFKYALDKKVEQLTKRVDHAHSRIISIYALPNEIEAKIEGEQFDYMFIDKFYDDEEVGKIREHLRGLQRKQIERF